MNPTAFFGWSAAGFMLLTFSCEDARWLRSLAICANVAFIAYGLVARLHPVAVLHLISLPINVYRLLCAMKTFELARACDDVPAEVPISPCMTRERTTNGKADSSNARVSRMNPLFFDDTADGDKPSRCRVRRGDIPRFSRRHSTRHFRLRQL